MNAQELKEFIDEHMAQDWLILVNEMTGAALVADLAITSAEGFIRLSGRITPDFYRFDPETGRLAHERYSLELMRGWRAVKPGSPEYEAAMRLNTARIKARAVFDQLGAGDMTMIETRWPVIRAAMSNVSEAAAHIAAADEYGELLRRQETIKEAGA
ncbi:hypothetical protein Srot_0047 [Segniliparus rotundus DSM 44985]|uniref:Uncharacterized protein n=1 Tax=Segniliparus rotundus (strain ATCC BAA-972 / CDC 1076 / CIP 108378 / DSM 44985 / JCM 13578) TaxID=640132 RepID=D6Z9L3_SEGRD|nr:hypothetical protein [Segniliparus rotundus]ADG96540.1 hypothetical protein Srot_0047 [Segniliparus rotundus DSM 44985]